MKEGVNRRERHKVNLISILQQDCLGFVVCCGPLACLSHFNECIFFFSTDNSLVTLPSLSLSNVSLQIKVLIRLQSCQNVPQIAGFLAGEGVLRVSGDVTRQQQQLYVNVWQTGPFKIKQCTETVAYHYSLHMLQ